MVAVTFLHNRLNWLHGTKNENSFGLFLRIPVVLSTVVEQTNLIKESESIVKFVTRKVAAAKITFLQLLLLESMLVAINPLSTTTRFIHPTKREKSLTTSIIMINIIIVIVGMTVFLIIKSSRMICL